MIEIQCTSCHTRYRIDERVLPDETPTFKCSRCGHVFNADPVGAKVRKPAAPINETNAEEPIAQVRAPESQVQSTGSAESRAEEPSVQKAALSSVEESNLNAAPLPKVSNEEISKEHPLDRSFGRSFGDREQKPDTGENRYLMSRGPEALGGDD